MKQWVHEEDQAWHAGIKKNPTALLVVQKGSINPNAYTIGIEFEGSGQDRGMPEQLTAGAELIRMLCSKYKIAIDSTHIIRHREIRSDKTCPGKLDVEWMMLEAQRLSVPALSTVKNKSFIEEQLVGIENRLANIREILK